MVDMKNLSIFEMKGLWGGLKCRGDITQHYGQQSYISDRSRKHQCFLLMSKYKESMSRYCTKLTHMMLARLNQGKN